MGLSFPSCGYYNIFRGGYYIKTESFVVGGGDSHYLIEEYIIKGNGDTIINVNHNLYHQVYVREIIQDNLNK